VPESSTAESLAGRLTRLACLVLFVVILVVIPVVLFRAEEFFGVPVGVGFWLAANC
jgi:hypothetical protein